MLFTLTDVQGIKTQNKTFLSLPVHHLNNVKWKIEELKSRNGENIIKTPSAPNHDHQEKFDLDD